MMTTSAAQTTEATTMQTHTGGPEAGHGRGDAPRSENPSRKLCVLVVEDDGQMRRLIAARLHARGYDVVEAEDGVDLLGWMGSVMWTPEDTPLDAIVTDVILPDLTALEVLAALRVRDAAIPIILVTGVTDEQVHQEAYALGASAILTKPFDFDELGTLLTGLTKPAASRPQERS
jgi:two-component system, OmpR family, response regulator RpaA